MVFLNYVSLMIRVWAWWFAREPNELWLSLVICFLCLVVVVVVILGVVIAIHESDDSFSRSYKFRLSRCFAALNLNLISVIICAILKPYSFSVIRIKLLLLLRFVRLMIRFQGNINSECQDASRHRTWKPNVNFPRIEDALHATKTWKSKVRFFKLKKVLRDTKLENQMSIF